MIDWFLVTLSSNAVGGSGVAQCIDRMSKTLVHFCCHVE